MDERRVRQLVGGARLRIRGQRVLEGLTVGLIPPLMVGAGWLVLVKTGWIASSTLGAGVGWTLVFPLAGLAWAFSSKIDLHAVAMRIDEANQLKARLTTALCFLEIPAGERTAFQQAAIREALPHLGSVRVAPAAPFALPASAWSLVLAVAGVAAVIVARPPQVEGYLPPPEPPPVVEAVFDDDDLKLAREEWDAVKAELQKSDTPEVEQLVGEMDDLLAKLDARELDKGEFLEAVDKIEDTFFKEGDEGEEWKQILDEMKEAGEVLKDDPLTKELASALKEGDMQKAAAELEKLGEALAAGKISDKDLDRLSKRLEDFSKQLEKNAAALEEALKEKEAELSRLQKQLEEKAKEMTPEEKQRLSRLERQLKELRRKKVAFDESGKGKTMKKLSQASKQGSEMASQAKKKGKGAAKDKAGQAQAQKEFSNAMKAAAEESRAVDKKAGEGKSKEQVAENLEKMKERLRRQASQKDAQAQAQKKAFAQKAEGKEPPEGEPKGSRDSGEKVGGEPGEQEVAKRDGGEKGGEKGGEQGEGPKSQGGKGDPEDAKNAKLSDADGEAGSQVARDGERAGGGVGDKKLGEETGLKDKGFVDTKVEGQAGAGPTRSEVVSAAASGGFASTPYREAYEYERRVAEEVLDQEQVPPGYRFYVQRYFEMIRPRGEGEGGGAAPGAEGP